MNLEIRDPFTKFQYRQPPQHLRHVIDFFWEAHFDEAFPIRLLPRPGCTLIFNLGQQFYLSNKHQSFLIRKHIVLPRQQVWEDNTYREHTFGIKLCLNFLAFERGSKPSLGTRPVPLPANLNDLLAPSVVSADHFEQRVGIAQEFFTDLIEKRKSEISRYTAFLEIMNELSKGNYTEFCVNSRASDRFLTSKTLLRYFQHCVDLPPKKAACMIRMRHALSDYFNNPGDFKMQHHGYYDYSHFCKEVVAITGNTPLALRNKQNS